MPFRPPCRRAATRSPPKTGTPDHAAAARLQHGGQGPFHAGAGASTPGPAAIAPAWPAAAQSAPTSTIRIGAKALPSAEPSGSWANHQVAAAAQTIAPRAGPACRTPARQGPKAEARASRGNGACLGPVSATAQARAGFLREPGDRGPQHESPRRRVALIWAGLLFFSRLLRPHCPDVALAQVPLRPVRSIQHTARRAESGCLSRWDSNGSR